MRGEQQMSGVGCGEHGRYERITKKARLSGGYVKLAMELRKLRQSVLLNLPGTSRGRILLHLLALRRNGNFRWHLAGVLRELCSRP